MDQPPDPDRELDATEVAVRAQLARSDDAGAAALVIRKLGPTILSYLRAVLKDHDDADDAFAYFAEDVWKGLPGFEWRASLRSWCYRVAWRTALRVLGDGYRRRRSPFGSTQAGKLAAEVRSSTQAHQRSSVKQSVDKLRRSLAPEEQTLLLLRVDRNLSWKEVVEVLAKDGEELDEAALRKRYERIKRRLRKLAIAEGLLRE